MITLRPEQQLAADRGITFLKSASPGERLGFSSPTGTGKSYVLLAIREALGDDFYIVAPNDDILSGMAAKAGVLPDQPGGVFSKKLLETRHFFTPVALRNRLGSGKLKPPKYLGIDETHHESAETYKLIDVLCSSAPAVGVTATFFRGTPRGTAEFRKRWGDPVIICTMKDAVKAEYMSFPKCSIVPLLDDDVVEVKNGEFVIAALDKQLADVRDRLVFECAKFWNDSHYDKPTMLSVPSVFIAEMYARILNSEGLPAVAVTGDTTPAARKAAFRDCINNTKLLIQIRVVSEGVDLPIRRLIDLAPTMSPVLWLQQFGRITRPTDDEPEYICTNRNLLRHAYLLEGLLPASVYASGEQAFGNPSERQAYRAIGLEGLGKFKSEPLPMSNGTTAQLICISYADGPHVTEFCAIASPLHPEVLYAQRVNEVTEDGKKYDHWKQIKAIPDIEKGYASVYKGSLQPKQLAWWRNAAHYYGLDREAKINTRQFVALPVMRQTGFRFRPNE
jgi:superfamily II DNA or RNA helicase